MTTRCGFAAIVGAPNAGKSTLLNRMTGAKLSIVSPKAQTTRFRVLGILMRAETQILLVDTPGIFAPKRKLDRAMVAAAWTGAEEADLTLLIVDAKAGARDSVKEIARRLAQRGARAWLVLNKVDLVPPTALLPLIATLTELAAFEETFMVSAAQGDGLDVMLDRLAEALPAGPYLYPPGRPDRSARPAAGGGDRARADLHADPRGSALRHHGGDGEFSGAPRWLRPDRGDGVCVPRRA